jgi:hypothetical protein
MPHASAGDRSPGLALVTLLALIVVVAGCASEEDEQAPSTCLASSSAYLAALQTAPGAVRLEGETPISDCLTPEQSGGQLARVGQAMIETATSLNADAREDPTGQATVELGYLVGAVSRGADSIHADLLRRLNAAARFSPKGAGILPAEFERTFGQGYAAGQESG